MTGELYVFAVHSDGSRTQAGPYRSSQSARMVTVLERIQRRWPDSVVFVAPMGDAKRIQDALWIAE
jgi:hypothetical protein